MHLIYLLYCLLVILAGAGAIEVGLRALQLFMAMSPRSRSAICPAPTQDPEPAFVSVHVPTCNEPPLLVIATLESLARSRFQRFEVIVVDNNTTDARLWLPVEAAVARLGPRFRFHRIERLAGAKAGALNAALAVVDCRTTHVAIVDADYQVCPDFLDCAVSAAQVNGVDYVQFPQAYRAVGRNARGIERELGDYFTSFDVGAGCPGSMLPTGTLSLFRVEALRAVGGWPMATITEDAEMGVRLQAAGYRGLWLTREVGHGLLPMDLRGMRKQRSRWSAGNFQVLKGLDAAFWQRPGLRDSFYLIAQLTAWITLMLPAAITLAIAPLLPRVPLRDDIVSLAAATVLLSVALTALRMMLLGDKRAALAVRMEAMVTKTALTWTSATAWLGALLPRELKFHRTAKAASLDAGSSDGIVLGVSLLFLAASAAYAASLQIGPALACLLLASVWPCGRFVDRALRQAAALNPEFG